MAAAAAVASNRDSGRDGLLGALGQGDRDSRHTVKRAPTLGSGTSSAFASILPRMHGASISRLEQEVLDAADAKTKLVKLLGIGPHGHWLVDSIIFKGAIMFLVVCNSIIMGVEVDYPEWKQGWNILDHIFGIAFFLEMIIKIIVLRANYFRDRWNWLDGILAVMGFMDTWFITIIGGSDLGLQQFSILRILRLLRLIRLTRLFRQFGKLVIVMNSIVDAIESTFWVACVLTMCIYVCAIFCVDFIGRQGEDTYPGYSKEASVIDEQEVMQNFNPHLVFGGIPQAMVTLFNIAILAEWTEIVRPVMVKQPAMVMFFIIFSIFVCFGVMNVIIGMIVDSVIQNARALERELEEAERKDKVDILKKLQQIIFTVDADGDKTINVEELEMCMNSTDDTFRELMNRINLPYGCHAMEFMAMLDNDADGILQYDEFVQSLYRLMHCDGFQQTCLIQMGLNDARRLVKDLGNETKGQLRKISSTLNGLSKQLQQRGLIDAVPKSERSESTLDFGQSGTPSTKKSPTALSEKVISKVDAICLEVESAIKCKLHENLTTSLDRCRLREELTRSLEKRLTTSGTSGVWEPIDGDATPRGPCFKTPKSISPSIRANTDEIGDAAEDVAHVSSPIGHPDAVASDKASADSAQSTKDADAGGTPELQSHHPNGNSSPNHLLAPLHALDV